MEVALHEELGNYRQIDNHWESGGCSEPAIHLVGYNHLDFRNHLEFDTWVVLQIQLAVDKRIGLGSRMDHGDHCGPETLRKLHIG